MKHFTIQWWSGEIEDQMTAFKAYEAYLAGVKHRLPGDLRRLTEDVSLHDSRLRRLTIVPEKRELIVDLDGCGHDQDQKAYHALRIRLAYSHVVSFESLADPDAGLPGPHGYGDLGYDEIDYWTRASSSTACCFPVALSSSSLSAASHSRVKKKRPNKPPEPTPTAVTSRACARAAPAAVVAHL